MLISVLGATLCFFNLGSRDFWFDESCTFLYVHRLFDWPSLSNLLIESTNLPYYVCLRGWTNLFGHSETAYRSLSALFAALTTPLLAWTAYRLFGSIASIACALLSATNPLLLYYAHEARAYAMWVFVLSLSLFLLLRAIDSGKRRWWVAYGVAIWLSLHLHYYTLFWIPTSALAVIGIHERRHALRQWLVTTLIVGLAFLPYCIVAVWPASQGGGSTWIANHFHSATAIAETIWAFLPAGGYPGHLRGLSLLSPDTAAITSSLAQLASKASRIIPAIIWLALLSVCVTRRFERPAGRAFTLNRRSMHLELAGMTLGPLIFAWLYSVMIRPIYLPGRYDLVAWPTFMLWSAWLIAEFSRRVAAKRSGLLAAMITLALISCSAVPLSRLLSFSPPHSLAYTRANRLAELAGHSDLVVTFSYDADYLRYDLFRAGCKAALIPFPSWLDQQVGWVDTARDLAPERYALLDDDAMQRVRLIETALRRSHRVWLFGDSMDRRVFYRRRPINSVLLSALRREGFVLDLQDDALKLYEVRRASPLDEFDHHRSTAPGGG